MVTRSGARWDDPGHGSAMTGGEEQSAPMRRRLECGNERGENGKWKRSSQRIR